MRLLHVRCDKRHMCARSTLLTGELCRRPHPAVTVQMFKPLFADQTYNDLRNHGTWARPALGNAVFGTALRLRVNACASCEAASAIICQMKTPMLVQGYVAMRDKSNERGCYPPREPARSTACWGLHVPSSVWAPAGCCLTSVVMLARNAAASPTLSPLVHWLSTGPRPSTRGDLGHPVADMDPNPASHRRSDEAHKFAAF